MSANVVTNLMSKSPPVEEDPNAKEIYADDFVGMSLTHGNLTLAFAVLRADHSKTPATNVRKVVTRIVIPISVAVGIEAVLGQTLKDLEAKGMFKRGLAGPLGIVQ